MSGSGLDPFHHAGLLAGCNRCLPTSVSSTNTTSPKRFLRVIADAHGDGAIGFQACPFVTFGKTQIGRDIAHVLYPRKLSAVDARQKRLDQGFAMATRRSV